MPLTRRAVRSRRWRFGQQILAPVVDERLLAEVGGGGERPFDGLPAEFLRCR